MQIQPTVSYDRSRELVSTLNDSRLAVPTDKILSDLQVAQIDPSKYLEARINNIFVLEDKETFIPLLNEEAELYLVGVAVDNISPEPLKFKVDTFTISASDPEKTEKPTDRQDRVIRFGPNGWSFYRSPNGQLPTFLDLNMILFESDEDIRNTGEIMQELSKNDEMKSLQKAVVELVKTVSTATWVGLAAQIALQVVGIVGGVLKLNQDDVISHLQASHSTAFNDIGDKDFNFSDANAAWRYQMRKQA